MSKCAIIVGRNDDYGGNLLHRAKHCINSLCSVFDNVVYVDWKTMNCPLTDSIEKKKNLHTIEVHAQDIIKKWPHLINYPVVESIARNIGIRYAIDNNIADWICSTNIDVVMTEFDENILDVNTLYTARRFNVPMQIHLQMSADNTANELKRLNQIHNFNQAQYSVIDGKGVWDAGDHWSLVVCCGDFQLAYKSLWSEIRGFEEEMAGRCYADSNLMKRPILIGKKTAVLENVHIFHLDHGSSSNRLPGEHLPVNDQHKYVASWNKSTNTKDWGKLN